MDGMQIYRDSVNIRVGKQALKSLCFHVYKTKGYLEC